MPDTCAMPPRLLAIDPGLSVTGYACLELAGGRPALVEAGHVRLARAAPLACRLDELDRDLGDLLARLQPACGAVESLFAHGRHPGPAITLGHARGVILLRLHRAGAGVVELPPATIKRAVAGTGRASKGQIQRAVQTILDLPAPPEPHDVADAIAIGLAALPRLGAGAVRDLPAAAVR